MDEETFFKDLASVFLTHVKSGKYPDLERIIVKEGGFNRRVFSPSNFFHQSSTNFIRFLVIMNLRMTEKDFQIAMKTITEMIIKRADNCLCRTK